MSKIIIIMLAVSLAGLCFFCFIKKETYNPEVIQVQLNSYGTIRIGNQEYVYLEGGNWLDFPLYQMAIGEVFHNDNEIIVIGVRATFYKFKYLFLTGLSQCGYVRILLKKGRRYQINPLISALGREDHSH